MTVLIKFSRLVTLIFLILGTSFLCSQCNRRQPSPTQSDKPSSVLDAPYELLPVGKKWILEFDRVFAKDGVGISKPSLRIIIDEDKANSPLLTFLCQTGERAQLIEIEEWFLRNMKTDHIESIRVKFLYESSLPGQYTEEDKVLTLRY